MATKHHLTTAFIKRQKERLEKERVKILQDIEVLKKNDPFSDPDHASDNAAVDTDVREAGGHDIIEAEVKDMEKRLFDIDHALEKIAKGSYGYCEKTNMPIPQARLELIPEARFTVEYEAKIKK